MTPLPTLTVVIPVLGQHELARLCIKLAIENKMREDTQVVVIDNGGDLVLEGDQFRDVRTFVPKKNLGVYPTFPFGFEITESDIVLFIHSDLLIVEKGYDSRIITEFALHPELGLVGFVGSNEIDSLGGRGLGTTSNFQGMMHNSQDSNGELCSWYGSGASVHGKVSSGISRAAVVDGCAMALTRKAWEAIGYRENFGPHHFYDKLISCQVGEAGFAIAVLGIACDHISGQTVAHERRYVTLAEEWSREHLSPDKWVGNPPDYAWDQTVYQESERQWLSEYRDQKHFIPRKV